MIAGICNNPNILSVVIIIKTIITIIRIAVPILLLLFGTIAFVRAVKNDEELDKAKKNIVSKVIAAIIIFFIPSFVSLISKIVGFSDYQECIDLATPQGVVIAYQNAADQAIAAFEESEEYGDYLNALTYINTIPDDSVRESSLQRLQELYDEIMIAEGVCTAEYENGDGYATISVNLNKGKAANYKFII